LPWPAILTPFAGRIRAVAVVAGIALVVPTLYLTVPYDSLTAPSEPGSGIAERQVDSAPVAGPVSATAAGPTREARERRRAEIREAHLRQLQPVLRADAERLSELARRIDAGGRVTRQDRQDSTVELRSIFVSHRDFSEDLQNHYPEYSRAKERLRTTVSQQEQEFRRATSLVMANLPMPPGTAAEHRRSEIARAVLEKCLERGPGMAPPTTGSDDDRAAFEAFASFQPDAGVVAHCESLKRRVPVIVASARQLSTEARALAERTTLSGECKYVSVE
jgi:hypothetical protein